MQLYLNKLRSTDQNVTVLLDTLTKPQILKELARVATEGDLFVIGQAEPLPEHDDTPASQLITLGEWLDTERIKLDKADKHRLANIIAKRYQEAHGHKPRVITRPDSKGRWWVKASGFYPADLPLLRKALLELRGFDK